MKKFKSINEIFVEKSLKIYEKSGKLRNLKKVRFCSNHYIPSKACSYYFTSYIYKFIFEKTSRKFKQTKIKYLINIIKT